MASQQTSGPMRRRSVASGASAVPALKGRGTVESAGRGERSPNGTRRRLSYVFRSRPSASKRSTELKYRRGPARRGTGGPPRARGGGPGGGGGGEREEKKKPRHAGQLGELGEGQDVVLGLAEERPRRTAEHAGPELLEQDQGGRGREPAGSRQPAVDQGERREVGSAVRPCRGGSERRGGGRPRGEMFAGRRVEPRADGAERPDKSRERT